MSIPLYLERDGGVYIEIQAIRTQPRYSPRRLTLPWLKQSDRPSDSSRVKAIQDARTVWG
jgi:hypothetical protein